MKAVEMARPFDGKVTGVATVDVHQPQQLGEAGRGALTWIKTFDDRTLEILSALQGALVVHPRPENQRERDAVAAAREHNALIEADPPRLLFARLLGLWFAHLELCVPAGVDPRAVVDESAQLGRDVTIGPFCFVGPEVEIGAETVLHPHAVVHSRSAIGRRCVLNSNVVVGGRGFGFVRDADGTLVHMPQVGRVVIEDDVELQAGCIVDRPALGETVILAGSKFDNLCHVSHGARVGPHACVTACAEIGARVVVQEGAWIGPQSCSLEGVTIGRRALVGLGAVVLQDVPDHGVVAGSPAEPTEELRRRRALLKRLLDPEA